MPLDVSAVRKFRNMRPLIGLIEDGAQRVGYDVGETVGKPPDGRRKEEDLAWPGVRGVSPEFDVRRQQPGEVRAVLRLPGVQSVGVAVALTVSATPTARTASSWLFRFRTRCWGTAAPEWRCWIEDRWTTGRA